jgi:SAM-dependent methyltransferase
MRPSFFPDAAADDDLEARNEVFWAALIDRIRADGFGQAPRRVLDIGCHRGGLLSKIAERWQPRALIGIEPIASARTRARFRLQTAASSVVLLDPTEWQQISGGSVDLVVSHEVLFLVSDLEDLVRQIARVLGPQGTAYIAAGCHAENPIWLDWRAKLEATGHSTFTHKPLDLMACAVRHALLPSVRPLRDSGWATHDPSDEFTFPSVHALLDHQFKHKLLFRLARR